MAEYSTVLNLELNPVRSKLCNLCGLYLNQFPVLDKSKNPNVFWVGLSAVQFDEDQITRQPLASDTRSGALIEAIENLLIDKISFYKTNLVKCLPLKEGKIRYPLEHEMEKCFPNLEIELNFFQPDIVFLLGKQVATFVLKKKGITNITLSDEFKYSSILINNITFIPIHHPSYIQVYKQSKKDLYIESIQKMCMNILNINHISYSIIDHLYSL
ncbi:uracil-DNA glycosylase family protein [Xanthocytophaga agilis]|uniref:Uracil-DNA glycosylase family protein n=1 Tax=Xanthocytophaga agilis TaxID=3048010 RepID=A0AAE3UEB7_9BACT|nr:uracil-DNA glycosylase family protein [Xanthocytophaga agilis]MDJ1502050.1 uracil-DNA glycosylase family protein [Xanthocytophaga agilis]